MNIIFHNSEAKKIIEDMQDIYNDEQMGALLIIMEREELISIKNDS